ncbi:alpha/beta fold hydrolase [Nakamurella sp. PAMC28650]|uniref:alpha/beta fold hydrolase n=1 Tax=Nakamurella sp. PAMC28650 TaxID=2762325 RepID=UPI00164D3FA2|nr:alpha/beta fold hydrolase [Nakamurella sp. PAMC28650]QNK79967.1 alpha/beta fold hydrolase [Nakamurella sp. PAMC28650]
MTAIALDLHSSAGLAFTDAGTGPPVLMIHGLISDRGTWNVEIAALAGQHRVIAPDLFGHGASVGSDPKHPALPNDYSLGGHAAALRDLLDELGLRRVVVVGHSLGGGIAMELAYLFPERVSALVLVSSGGLGSELSPALRAATLPGSEWVLPLIGSDWARYCGNTALSVMQWIGLPWVSASTTAAWAGMATFSDALKRSAFLATTRSMIGLKGQTISALPRLKQLADRPILVIWGGRDRLIPAAHAEAVKELLPHSTIEIFARAGHFPHLDEPDRFHRVLSKFLGRAASSGR